MDENTFSCKEDYLSLTNAMNKYLVAETFIREPNSDVVFHSSVPKGRSSRLLPQELVSQSYARLQTLNCSKTCSTELAY